MTPASQCRLLLRCTPRTATRSSSFAPLFRRSLCLQAARHSSSHHLPWTTAGLLAFGVSGLLWNQVSAEAPQATDSHDDSVADPVTGQTAPKTIHLPSCVLQLVGIGVRTVSFLSIRVYVASLYMSPDALSALTSVCDPCTFTPESLQKGNPEGEALLSKLLDTPTAFAIRIDPTRTTDFSHWRDAFIRSLTQRVGRFSKEGQIDEAQQNRAFAATDELRSIFSTGKAPKGKALLVLRKADGSLEYIYEDRTIGTLKDPWVAKQMILSYFSQPVISDKLQASVSEGMKAAMELKQ